MKQILVSFSFIVGFFIGTYAQAAWGPGGCAAVVAEVPRFEVKYANSTELAVYYNGVQIGNFNYKTKVFRSFDAGVWGPETKIKTTQYGTGQFFGVESAKLHKDGVTRHYINGKRVARQEAVAAIRLADDSAKPFITFIGDGRERSEER